jgi:hydroxyacylglutathione hydrolase
MEIHRLQLRLSNAYLICGKRPILVDTGSPGEVETLRKKLQALNVEFTDLALILHTHVHSDHFGNTATIAAKAKCPISYHPSDQPIVDRATNGSLKGVGFRGRIMARVFSQVVFKAVKADVPAYEGMSLREYGCDAQVIETPGHTLGSISVLTGDGNAIIGDVIMGGWMGGLLLPNRPNYHYFADDFPLGHEEPR